jgi:SAM-dependent methyltransferase
MLELIRGFVRRNVPVLTMSPDCYQRYKFISDILRKEGCRTILDVGGGSGRFFKRFLPEAESFTFDAEEGDIIGDAKNIPFSDRSFDAVTCIDTLQYIGKADYKKVLSELTRVAKKCVVLSFPTDNPDVVAAEIECDDAYKKLFGRGNRWLDEHIKLGLPNIEKVKAMLAGRNVRVYPICNLARWKKMFLLGIRLQKRGLILLATAINVLYVAIYGADTNEPAYTNVLVVKAGAR